MNELSVFNALVGIFLVLIGFLLNTLWNAVKDLQAADTALVKRVGDLDVLVAGNYVRRDELERVVSSLFLKLDRIENKLDGKVDKHGHGH